MEKSENISKHQPSCKSHEMPKYYTLHAVKTVHVCSVYLLHCKIYTVIFFISQKAELKTVSFLLLPEEMQWLCGKLHASVHKHPARLQQWFLQTVHKKNAPSFPSFKQTASHFLLDSIMVRMCSCESTGMRLQNCVLVLEVCLVSFTQPYCPVFDPPEGKGPWKRDAGLHCCSNTLSWLHKSHLDTLLVSAIFHYSSVALSNGTQSFVLVYHCRSFA